MAVALQISAERFQDSTTLQSGGNTLRGSPLIDTAVTGA